MTKSDHPRHPRDLHLSRRFYGLMLIFTTLAVIVILTIFFSQKITQREKLAHSLPADRTVAFLEFNFDPSRSQTKEISALANQNLFLQSALVYLNATIPHPDTFHQWNNGRGGLALLQNPTGQGMQPALFLQITNRDQAQAWINQLILDPKNDALIDENYLGQKLISFRSGQVFNILLSNDYLILAESLDNLKSIAETSYGSRPSLRLQPYYNQLISALPDQNEFFLYLDRAKTLELLSHSQLFLAGRLASFKLYFPFLNLFSKEAIAIQLNHDATRKPLLQANHLAIFNGSVLPAADFFSTDYSYSGDLEKLLPEGTFFTIGGVNLLDQKNKLQAYFKDRSTVYDLLFSGILNSFKDNLAGADSKINLDQDFFPIFQKQYLFFASTSPSDRGVNTPKTPNFGTIIETDHADNDLLKMEKILLAIGPKIAAQLSAKPTTITLPDGTTGKVLQANLPAPQKLSINLAGQSVEQIQFSSDFSLYLVVTPSKKHLLLSTSSAYISQILTASTTPSTTTTQPQLLPNPTETYSLNIHSLTTFWPTAATLKPLQSISIARKFTQIGLLSIYQLGF